MSFLLWAVAGGPAYEFGNGVTELAGARRCLADDGQPALLGSSWTWTSGAAGSFAQFDRTAA